MSVTIDIRSNFPAIAREIAKLEEDVRRRATVSALNKTIEQGRTQIVRGITRAYNINAAKVRERLRIDRARYSAGKLELSCALVGTGKRSMNLIAFVERSVTLAQARKRMAAGEGGTYTLRNGASVSKAFELRFKIRRDAPAKTIKGAFIANQGRTVFIRVGKERLPIEALSTIDVPQMFNAKRLNKALIDFLLEKFPAVWEHEAEFYLSRFNSYKAFT